jgi:hypothetical protein
MASGINPLAPNILHISNVHSDAQNAKNMTVLMQPILIFLSAANHTGNLILSPEG